MTRKSKLLTKKELTKACKKLKLFVPTASDKKLATTFNFNSHVDALVFIARITVHAEVLQHHPDISFSYRKVKVLVTTHEVKGLTKKDFELAERIERITSGVGDNGLN